MIKNRLKITTNFILKSKNIIAEKLLIFRIKFVCYFQPIDYLDMANLTTDTTMKKIKQKDTKNVCDKKKT